MKSMDLLLSEAETDWRNEIRRDFPLYFDMEVVRRRFLKDRDWSFSTDLKKIYAEIFNDKSLQKKFQEIVAKYWDGDPEELAKETLHYLLYHELYHPWEAPFSVTGDKNDNKEIHQSIRRGIIKAEPELSALEQISKVKASQNGIKDFILDNRFFLDNKEKKYVRDDVIPIWDLLELDGQSPKTNLYTITRFLYGVMYGPKSIYEFFEEKSGEDGFRLAEKSLTALIKKPIQLPTSKVLNNEGENVLIESVEDEDKRIHQYVKDVRGVFSGSDRYSGIERFMEVLGPYVEENMNLGGRFVEGESGAGDSSQSILEDLLDDMDEEDQADFVQDLSGENSDEFSQDMNGLDLFAYNEFYKRNHPKVAISGGNRVGESVVVGKQKYWSLKNSSVLRENQLSSGDMSKLTKLVSRTKLPWLVDFGDGLFGVNEYEIRSKDLKDVVYVDQNLDVPDMVEFYLDSSGSMFTGEDKNGFNDGSRLDMLNNVVYGFVDALVQGGKQLGKSTKMRIHNFAYTQVDSDIISVDDFWKGDLGALNTLFNPNNGGSSNLSLKNYRNAGKTAYVICTDGEIQGNSSQAKEMKKIARYSNNDVLFFEIGGTYSLGEAVRSDPNIFYHQVHDKDKMLDAGLEVLLSKW